MELSLRTPEGLLTLLQVRDVGSQTAFRLASRFECVKELLATPEETRKLAKRAANSVLDRAAWEIARTRAKSIIEKANESHIRIISFFDEAYPTLLKRIPDPPAILYVKGQLREGSQYVACVGTRHPSQFGTIVAKRLTTMLTEKGYSIVSGLALGIDSESHRAALDARGHTVAILANGLDTVYPAKNKELAKRIVDQGGALVSEQPPGTRAFAQNLVQRDRLQCGMSLATFVMQTDVVGGTMHTVRFTLEQQRLLFVPVPTEAYAGDQPSQGIRALVEHTGAELAEILKAKESFRSLLVSQFANRSPAIRINDSSDYEAVLKELCEAGYILQQRPITQGTLF